MQHAETAAPCPASPPTPNGPARANATMPAAHRRPAAHRSHPARLRPPSRRNRSAPLRQHRLQRHRCLLRHRPAVCDPRAPATRSPTRRRAGARVARARGTRPGYWLRRTARARDRAAGRAGRSAGRRYGSASRSAGRTCRASGEQPAAARVARNPRGRPARPAGTIPNCSCRPWRNSRRRCAAVRSAARWSISASTWRWCRASAPVVLERAVRQHPLARRQRRHADAGEGPPGGGVLQGAGQDARGAIGIGRRWDGTRSAACWVLHRRRDGRSVDPRTRNYPGGPRRPHRAA